MILLDIGINDIFAGQSTDTTAAEIGQIIDKIRAHNPAAAILLALLSPMMVSTSPIFGAATLQFED